MVTKPKGNRPSRKGRAIAHTPARLAADAAKKAARQAAASNNNSAQPSPANQPTPATVQSITRDISPDDGARGSVIENSTQTEISTGARGPPRTTISHSDNQESARTSPLLGIPLDVEKSGSGPPSAAAHHVVENNYYVVDSIHNLVESDHNLIGNNHNIVEAAHMLHSLATPFPAASLDRTHSIEPQAAEEIALSTTKEMVNLRPTTPEGQLPATADSSGSGLSSVPTSLGSTPRGLRDQEGRFAQNFSPTRIVPRKPSNNTSQRTKAQYERGQASLPEIGELSERFSRSRSGESTEDDDTLIPHQQIDEDYTPTPQKPLYFGKTNDQGVEEWVEPSPLPTKRLTRNGKGLPSENIGKTQQSTLAVDDESDDSTELERVPPKSRAQLKKEKDFYDELKGHLWSRDGDGFEHSKSIWTRFNPDKVVMYGADAQTRYTPAYGLDPSRKAAKPNKGGARGGRGGRGGKGKSGGRGRDDDTPEPSMPKRTNTQAELDQIKVLRARQAEIRRWSATVVANQVNALDHLAATALDKLAKKPKAHKQVPEYNEVIEDLNARREEAHQLTHRHYEIAVEAENRRYEAERAAVGNRFNTTITDLQEEYTKGAQGDLIIFRNSVAAANDDTRTQDGSEAGAFPQYHELPEPDQNIRGYTSTRFSDERPFKYHLRSYDDQARREVIESDIITAFMAKTAEIRASQPKEKMERFDALATECSKRLEEADKEEEEKRLAEPDGYLIPRAMAGHDTAAYGLSALADASEFMAHRYPNKQYIYMPLEDDDRYPREQLDLTPLPGRNVVVPPPPQQVEQSSSARKIALPKPPSAQVQGARRSLRNIQPNSPFGQSQSQPTTPVTQTPVQTPPFPLNTGPSSGSAPPQSPATVSNINTSVPPTLAPAPARLMPATNNGLTGPVSSSRPQTRPPPIDTRTTLASPINQSPIQPPQGQQGFQGSSTLPPLQPRQLNQAPLPHPSQVGYPLTYAQYSPIHPYPQAYPQYPYGSPYQSGPAPSPYINRNQHHQYGNAPHPPPPQFHSYGPPPMNNQPTSYSFMPPQQGPIAPAQSPTSRHHARTHSTTTSGPAQSTPAPSPYQSTFARPIFSNPLLHSPAQPSAASPSSSSGGSNKSRRRAKPSSVQFVNQTQATRKAAAEQAAREDALKEEKKDREGKDKKDKDKDGEGSGRKLAPKP